MWKNSHYKKHLLSHREIEYFLYQEDSENEFSALSSSNSGGSVDSKSEEEVIQVEKLSSNELGEKQVLENEKPMNHNNRKKPHQRMKILIMK